MMFKNYAKICWRNLLRHKSYSLLNLAGLGTGIAAALLILLSIQFEINFDDFQQDADRLFRVSIIQHSEGKTESESHIFTPQIGPDLLAEFPDVERFVRLSTPRVAYVRHGGIPTKVESFIHADSSFFDLFSFDLLAGDPDRVLNGPFKIVLNATIARRIFADQDPLGQIVTLGDTATYEVTGIVAAPPANSHIQFDGLISFSTLYRNPNLHLGWDGGNQYVTYIRLKEGASAPQLEKRLPDFMWRHINEKYANFGIRLDARFQPFRDIHLRHNPLSKATMSNITIFASVACLILLIACINFVNLTTARGAMRAREVGVRKVLGASKEGLIRQFLGENVTLSFLAMIFALVLVWLFLPVYRNLLNKDIHWVNLIDAGHLSWLLLIVLFVGVVAGSYPALYLSSFQAIRTLKGVARGGSGRGRLRNTLVLFQFAVSTALLICTILISNQLSLLGKKPLGFNQENLVVLPLIQDEQKRDSGTLKKEIARLQNIRAVAASSEVPHRGFTSNGYVPEGFENPIMIHVADTDEDFLETFDITLVAGRNFSRSFATDKRAIIVNEKLVRTLGWEDPIGKIIRRNGDFHVIGVVEDFHFATLHEVIEPLIITNRPWRDRFDYLTVKIAGQNTRETLMRLENTWQSIAPGAPFEFWFLDEKIDSLYESEQRFRGLFIYFSILALAIALAGLVGLASFSTEQRTKEIGIRKILGATPQSVIKLLTGELMILVVLSNLIAGPVAWYVMRRWLQDFAYQIDIAWWVFALAGSVALLITALVVCFQAAKAALMNPVDALRYE